MGINLNKIHSDQSAMLCHSSIENPDQAGSIYLVIHRSQSENQEEKFNKIGANVGKTSHYCLAVDITGT